MWTLKLISVLCLFSNLFAIVPPNLTPSKDKVWNRVNGKFTNLEKLQKSNKTLLVTKQSFLEPNSDPLARYAFTYLNNRNPVAITTPATNSTNNMAVSGIGGVSRAHINLAIFYYKSQTHFLGHVANPRSSKARRCLRSTGWTSHLGVDFSNRLRRNGDVCLYLQFCRLSPLFPRDKA